MNKEKTIPVEITTLERQPCILGEEIIINKKYLYSIKVE